MALTRLKGWAALLDAFIHARAATPFAYGKNDCALFAADAVKVITGTDLAASFRGTYTDEASADAVIAEHGGSVDALAAAVAVEFGMAEVKPLMAQRGDLVVINVGTGLAMGIVGVDGAVYGTGDGLHRLNLKRVTRAWRV